MRKLLLFGIVLSISFTFGVPKIQALSGSDWQPGHIIDDSLFFNGNSMTTAEIQLFLNSKVPICDTNGTQAHGGTTRASYGISAGYPPPYTCLKDYRQDTPGMAGEPGLCGQYDGGNKSAAEIIHDVGAVCGVSQKAILVLLQKEQALVTDDWPWSNEYRSATGYGCPDTAACDAQYYGFFNQVYNAARQYKHYQRDPTLFGYRSNRTNYITYNPLATCGGSNVYIQNQATAGLYSYTPYQPNAMALSNIYGSQTDGCSSYGNRNFWRMYNDWFGSVNGPAYSWQLSGVQYYTDSARTQRLSNAPTVQPGGKVYITIKAYNNGYLPWDPSFIRLGTANPRDHTSPYRDNSWLFPTRLAQLAESTIEPSQTGTFNFSITAPQSPGVYQENFDIVAEGNTWLNDIGAYYSFNVVNQTTMPNPSVTNLSSGQTLNVNESLLAPLSQSSLSVQRNGNLVLSQDYEPAWQTFTNGQVKYLVMQTDGNLVLYDNANQPLWNTSTGGNPGAHLSLQLDGNLVLYSSSNSVLWSSNTVHIPNYISYVNTTLQPGTLLKGQWLETADRRYKMILQNDGNLVIYSPSRAIWATHTDGIPAAYLAMQSDGNLVLYDTNDRPIWQTATNGWGLSALVLQQDGNLVTYQGMAVPSWNTRTAGQQ